MRAVLLLVALCASVASAGYLYADSSLDFGTTFGIVKWNPDLQQASPKVLVSIDVTDVGDGYYNGGCVDPANGIGYMILGNGTQAGPYELITVTLSSGKYTGPTKFVLPMPGIDQWWVWAPAMAKILTAAYAKDTLAIYAVDPVSLQVTSVAAINVKLDYFPGNIAMDAAGNIMYFTMQAHSTTTLYSVNCTSGKTSAYVFPAGHNVQEVTWDSANARLIGLNITYSWLGPIPTDPMDHVVAIDPAQNFATTQFGLPNRQLSHMLWGVAANNGTHYWHAVEQVGPGSFDHVVGWGLDDNSFMTQNLLQWQQPQSWMAYMDE